MPMGVYSSFAECLSKNKDKGDPSAYCGEVYWRTEGKDKLKKNRKGSKLNKANKRRMKK